MDAGVRLPSPAPTLDLSDPLVVARFWSKVGVGTAGECWPWRGRVDENGYGRFGDDYAHRVAFRLIKGELPPGVQVRHRCDSPPCFNPDHHLPGDHAANMADKVARGRQARVRGERHGRAKLTDKEVAAIRRSAAPGKVLAERYGVASSTISEIRSFKARQVSTGKL